MDSKYLFRAMDRFQHTLPGMVSDVDPASARWRPKMRAWSLVEIVTHLADEEELDFGPRLRSTLEDPGRPWEPIEPEAWVTERDYQSRNIDTELGRFLELRAASLGWLRDLQAPDWSSAHEHPGAGTISAGGLLTSWAAHDVLHTRQIAQRFHELFLVHAAPHDSAYALP